ncbi:MAG: exonuclease SbcCD subunit D [Candidatus Thermoplasmatota archaeon]|nr:exonuclease SbcCD subunit D [Euryarchaeota archaeon]MBU4033016.1 exonuclease SbcCD subunit D [Candidatus Thermoplasmatota archaeon]MBU4070634.1 exonuclease SbcCD subunit D [Candidatus Thermoplasmatota archaeon]MBU4145129.1 exonuclease SbcCD subunit D [Candidatus Thermoplasmatota archaeon]MBU4591579.1 exonuclease SbcCD subunit D [Candidatus Thermoplasmatota archaeon]
MKIFHVADTHIGYSAYSKLDSDGYNQREMDVFSAFSQFVNICLKESPDLVLHSGDLFDTVRPSNRAISFVMGQLLKLSGAGIPIVVISGNHSTPRLRETGSIFKIFEHIEKLYLAYDGRCHNFKFGDLKVHALPHSADKELFDSELNAMKPDSGFTHNIAMLHSGVAGLGVFKMSEFNELVAAGNQLEKGFDYVALGHYHEHCRPTSSAVYSGSTERLGFGEAGQPKGFVKLDLDTGKWKFRELDTRPMLDFRTIDCTDLKANDIFAAVRDSLESANIDGAIVRQRLSGADRGQMGLLDNGAIRKMASDALHYELRGGTIEAGQKIASVDAAFESMEKEFISYIHKIAVEGADPKKIEVLGLEYLQAGGEK